ncbi:MAG: hypothetical protein AB1797_06235 [bacterium]
MMDDPLKDPIGSCILRAFAGPQNMWRTPGGVARETGLSLDTVNSYLNHNLFRQSPLTPNGTPLYTLASSLKSKLWPH